MHNAKLPSPDPCPSLPSCSQAATVVLIRNLENEVYLSSERSIASKFLGSEDDKDGEWNHAVY